MEIVLLQRIEKLGQMGDVVSVKDGYARNFLLPQGKALRATKPNLARFETERTQLEAQNLEQRGEAEAAAAKLDGQQFVIIRQAFRDDSGRVFMVDSQYGHLDRRLVQKYQLVKRGQQIGTIGTNHGMYLAHLHLEIHKNLAIGMLRSSFTRGY